MSRLDVVVEQVPTDRLKSAPINARSHSPAQKRKMRRIVKRYGFLIPVVIDASDRIVCGHLRVETAKALGLAMVPAIRVTHLTQAEIEAFALADNRISDDGKFDQRALREILVAIEDLDFEFDLADTAFETAEIDLSLAGEGESEPDPPVSAIDRSRLSTSRVGDCWRIGPHAVVCGDARDPSAYRALLGEEVAQLVIADDPYNLPVNGMVSGLGRHQHSEFPMASGEMSRAEFVIFLAETAEQLIAFSCDGSIHYHFIDHRHIEEMLEGAGKRYAERKNVCVWVKGSGGMGSLYRSQYELVFVFKNGTAPHINNVQLGRHGRNRTNVWQYAGANSFGPQRQDLALHATVKPIELLVDAIMDCSERGGIVLDPFLGSGSTILAADRTGRKGRGIELDPYYVDLSVQRIAAAVGQPAILTASGQPFEDVAHARANPGWGEAT